MLQELHIQNIAVIDEVTVSFGNGLHVLTGETGAGKSILIDAINMALGSRTSKDLIRTGAAAAVVDLVFSVSDTVLPLLEAMDIEAEDNTVIVSRKLSAEGKSICRINGIAVPVGIVRQVGALLLAIHGQNDNQEILSPAAHLKMVDTFGKNTAALSAYRSVYEKRRLLMQEIEELETDEAEKARRIDLLQFQTDEIAAAALRSGEEEELEEKRTYLLNIEKIMEGASGAYAGLYGDEESAAAYDLISDALRYLENVSAYDSTLSAYQETLSSVLADLEDVTHGLKSYLDRIEFEDGALDRVEERLGLIAGLKRKYGKDIPAILAYYDRCTEELNRLSDSEETLVKLHAELDVLNKELAKLAAELTSAREKAAAELQKRVLKELADLDMQKMQFVVAVTEKATSAGATQYGPDGCDNVAFLISANPGEALHPLIKIASGGEMSRIMLALKSVLSDADVAESLIFDEIDTGVSGRAAQKIAEKMAALAKTRQVLCITHLAQIASMADIHYSIEKHVEGARTKTTVRQIEGEERMEELARIIGGVQVTELTRKNAAEMLGMAEAFKESAGG